MADLCLKQESENINNYGADDELVQMAQKVNSLINQLHDLWARFEDDLPTKYEPEEEALCAQIEFLRTKALDIVPTGPMGALAFADMAMHFGDICDTINGIDLNEKHSGMASLYAKQLLNNQKCCPEEAKKEAKRITDYATYLRADHDGSLKSHMSIGGQA